MKEIHIHGYEEFSDHMKNLTRDPEEPVFIYFTGSKVENGTSWCPDCNVAEPILREAILKCPDNAHFIYVDVGDRTTWKDLNNPFRLDKQTNLQVIPTLIKWGGPQRLEGEHLEKVELVEMLFTDEDD